MEADLRGRTWWAKSHNHMRSLDSYTCRGSLWRPLCQAGPSWTVFVWLPFDNACTRNLWHKYEKIDGHNTSRIIHAYATDVFHYIVYLLHTICVRSTQNLCIFICFINMYILYFFMGMIHMTCRVVSCEFIVSSIIFAYLALKHSTGHKPQCHIVTS